MTEERVECPAACDPVSLDDKPEQVAQPARASLLSSLLQRPSSGPSVTEPPFQAIPGVKVGELLALEGDERSPLVRFPGQVGEAAARAQSLIDLDGRHVGRPIVLMFENGDPSRPIVMGLLQRAEAAQIGNDAVEISRDGERLIISAIDRLVLRCGKAQITLTKAGKVIVEGSYLVSRSSGVNRIRGGSIQLN